MVFVIRKDKIVKINTNTIKFRPEWFAAYGLTKEKNFLQAPICECGCGGKCNLLLDDKEALFGAATELLLSYDCNCCAIFAHAFDENMYGIIKAGKYVETPIVISAKEPNMKFFQTFDNVIHLHCYGLLIETKRGEWKIIED